MLFRSVEGMFREIHIRPVAAALLGGLAAVALHRALPVFGALHQAWYLIPIKLGLDFCIFAPVYVVVLMGLRQITGPDVANFLGVVSFGAGFLRHPFRERVKIYR